MFYSGLAGIGHGVFVLSNGRIVGADASGAEYDGIYESKNDDSGLVGELHLKIPPNVVLVTGAIPSSAETALKIPLALPSNFASGGIVSIQTTSGPINAVFKKIRDLNFPKDL